MTTTAVHRYLAEIRTAQAVWAGTTDQGPTYAPATVAYLAAYDAAADRLETTK